MKNVKLNIFEKISLWWKFEARYYHRDLIYGVKNLIRWFPTIWKDRDWDDHFIWEIMKQKLKFQSKFIDEKDFYVGAKRDVEIINTCIRLIEKIRTEEYSMEYMDYHKTKHEFIDCDNPSFKEIKTTEIYENFDEYFKKYPRQYKKVLSGEINKFKRKDVTEKKSTVAMEIGYENHERARKLLFKLLETNIERWWV